VLEDISRAEAPATVLGRATIDPAGQPPFRFAIRYDDAAVQPERRDAARATVRCQGRLLFTTDRAHPVLAGSGGCNRVAGGFELDGEKLKLGPMAGTAALSPVTREGGAPPHPGEPPRDARCDRHDDRAVRGDAAALSEPRARR
jgi:hypothetical protein